MLKRWFVNLIQVVTKSREFRNIRTKQFNIELLERRDTPNAKLLLDFNSSNSPTSPGWTGVSLIAYSAANGLGWQSLNGISSINRSKSNPLLRDIHTGTNGTFLADVPNGTYDMALGIGDYSLDCDKVAIYAENQLVNASAKSGKRQFLEARSRVTVNDGQLTIKLQDMGGATNKFSLNYLTLNPVDNSAKSLFGTSHTPANNRLGNGIGYELGIKLKATVDGFITGIRFYKGKGNTGVHIGNLWTSDGIKLGSAQFVSETSSGWQEVSFSTPIAILANKTYIASYSSPTGSFSYTQDYFANSGLTNGQLSTVTDSTTASGLLWRIGAKPPNSFVNSEYGVDVVFSKDVVAPLPTNVSPANLSTDIGINSNIKIVFSEQMNPRSVNSSSIWLQTKSGVYVGSTVSYDLNSKSATLTPESSLSGFTDYEIVINGRGSASVAVDLYGNPIEQSLVYAFQTGTDSPVASMTFDSTISENDIVHFNGIISGGTGQLTYAWDFGDGTSQVTDTLNPSHKFVDSGSYQVSLTVTDSKNKTTSVNKIAFVANINPIATLLSNCPVTAGNSVTVSLTNQYDPSEADTLEGFRYSYDFDNDGNWEIINSTVASYSTIVSRVGIRTVVARITDKDGGFSDYATSLIVNSPIIPTPAAPANLLATKASQSEIFLTWNLGDSMDTSVVIERKNGSGGSYQVLATLPYGENLYTDSNCWASTTYTYRVRALNAGGSSEYSVEASATTSPVSIGALIPPADLIVQPISPTSATISFSNPNAGVSCMFILERSLDNISFQIVASLGSATSFTNIGLTPGSSYFYRVRATSWSKPTSDYSKPVAISLAALSNLLPATPTDFEAINLSSSSTQLRWLNNAGSNVQFRIERANLNIWKAQTWSQIAITGPGETTFVDTGLVAETPYAYRIRAINSYGDSPNARPKSDIDIAMNGDYISVTTASAGTGAKKTYDIGPGKPYPTINSLDWSSLGPGDTVNIHYKLGGYHELFQISTRGTINDWITINGVPDPATGALPAIDGNDAILASQFANHYSPVNGSGIIVVGAKAGYVAGYKPGYLIIQNLQLCGAYNEYTFSDTDGSVKNYSYGAAGVYLERADHVTLKKLIINNNGNGVFGAGQSGFDRLMTNITLDSNKIFGNGNVNRFREHNTYLEAIDTIYQFNEYGPLRAGSFGAGLKDRSVGTIIRNNLIRGGAHQLQLPEVQNQASIGLVLTRYRQLWVYGNVFITEPGNASEPIMYGGDDGLDVFFRKGKLMLYHNTFVVQSNRSQVWRLNIVELSSSGESLDARNNIFSVISHDGTTAPNAGLISGNGMAYFGTNLLSAGFAITTDSSGFYGIAGGRENNIFSFASNPGFINAAGNNFHLNSDSIAIDLSGRLSGSTAALFPDFEYVDSASAARRILSGVNFDIGAFEQHD